MKTKVMLLISDLGMGGAENITMNIAKYINKEEFEVKVVSMFSREYCVDKYKDIIDENRLQVTFLNKKPGLDLSIVRELMRLFKTEKPDVIHTHRYSCIYALIPSVICRLPVRMHTVHNIARNELPQLYQKIMRFAYKHLHVTPVAINESVKKSIEENYGLSSKQIPLIKNGVDISKLYSNTNVGDKITLINVGRFSPQKNHSLLIECFKDIVANYPDAELILVGDGELKADVQIRVNAAEIAGKVIFVGNVSDVENYLARADIFVMSSDYEGLPLSVIEAMASGLPVVSTKAGGVVDLVHDGENGILVDVGDKDNFVGAVLSLIKDRESLKKMGEVSRKIAEGYSVDKMVRDYENLYRKKL
ncbi:glycosyltransferase [Clostridium sp. AF15-17LB]|nr:glycosyltransferase [Clostridium sp. AF15-17LB]